MGSEIQKNLTQRANDLLQTEEEHSLFELMELLREYRIETHPDKFQDQDLRTKAEARFKEAQSLLTELGKQLEVDRFNRKPKEMAIYKPLYDSVMLQIELDRAKDELEQTKSELKRVNESNDYLNNQLQVKDEDSLNAEIEHLQSIYTPSTRKFASIGLGILLSGTLVVMSQMEQVSSIFKGILHLGKSILAQVCFSALSCSWLRCFEKCGNAITLRVNQQKSVLQDVQKTSWNSSRRRDLLMLPFLNSQKLRFLILSLETTRE